ncbi:Por secretion system C-terminal sorting domain-containing protein [Catalinimonas alkaloidigena]|uniref:Por secretion system C-terminal sorting domain-containing protein n=1 Tax=Catalinimonas alkaloidigena TaxID=1075417 RepID=A0A1G9NE47_9BACT|nr:T9SS type A sorting domain-containing protein [Catalinimonas alkaloidigena]SDL84742.1 Por secretion system C-terminal sorting domain-containing protein [Catalinimonas alkaloidigena]
MKKILLLCSIWMWAGMGYAQVTPSSGTPRPQHTLNAHLRPSVHQPAPLAPSVAVRTSAPDQSRLALRPLAGDQYQLDSMIYSEYTFDEPVDSMAQFKYTYQYDDQGRVVKALDYLWEDVSWTPQQRVDYLYNAGGQLSQKTVYYFDVEQLDWIGSDQYIYTYNAAGDTTQINTKGWFETYWLDVYRYAYAYDANGKATYSTRYQWNEESWMKSDSLSHQYDAQGHLQEATTYYSADGTTWELSSRYIYTYTAAGQLEEYAEYDWEEGAWSPFARIVSSYDAQGRAVEQINYTTDSETDAWLENYRMVSQFAANGTRTSSTYYTWDGEAWTEAEQETFQYQPAASELVPQYPFWLAPLWRETASTTGGNTAWLASSLDYIWDADIPDWAKASRVDFYYSSPTVSSSPTVDAGRFRLYPNPAAGQVQLDLSQAELNGRAYTLALRTITGQALRQWTQRGPLAQLSVAGLSRGVYLLEVTLPEGRFHKRLVVE